MTSQVFPLSIGGIETNASRKVMACNSNQLAPVAFGELKNGDQVAFKRRVELEKFNPAFKFLNHIAGDYYFHHGIFVEPNSIIHQTCTVASKGHKKFRKNFIMTLSNCQWL